MTHNTQQKNAFEIRLEILKMANDNVWQKYHSQISALHQKAQLESTCVHPDILLRYQPKENEILKYARNLYTFIDARPQTSISQAVVAPAETTTTSTETTEPAS